MLALVLALALNADVSTLFQSVKAQSCGGMRAGDPATAVCEAVRAQPTPDAAATQLASTLGVTKEAAALIAEAQLRLLDAQRDQNKPLPSAETAHLDRELRRLVKDELPILTTILQLAAASEITHEQFMDLAMPLVQKRPVDDVVRLADVLRWPRGVHLAAAALQQNPDHPELLELVGRGSGKTAGAFGPVRIEKTRATLRETYRALPPDVFTERATRQIRDLLAYGRAVEALAVLDALPQETRAHILTGATPQNDLRLDIAAAYVLFGNLPRARVLLRSVPESSEKRQRGRMMLLERAIAEQPQGDLFDTMIAVGQGGGAHYIFSKLYASLLERGGYPQVAADVLRGYAQWTDVGYPYAPEVSATLAAAIETDAAAMRARADLLAPENSNPNVTRLLRSPRLNLFTEQPAQPEETAPGVDVSTLKLPRFAFPLRAERSGNDLVVLGMSYTLEDPGAYWVLRSSDGGGKWAWYYTGQRQTTIVDPKKRNYRLPLLRGDRVQIDVNGRAMSIAWADLTRDTDRDGLTDLAEERIVTDPNDADTDDDGVADGPDLLPQVAASPVQSAASEALGAALKSHKLPEGLATFLIADPAWLAPLEAGTRLVVLTPEQRKLYEEKFGAPLGAVTVKHFAVDRNGTRALVEFLESWKSATLLLEKGEKGWTARTLSSWVS